MNYFEYLFSDKKTFKFWIPFYVLFVFPFMIVFTIGLTSGEPVEEPAELIYPIFLLTFSFLSFFVFYTTGYINLKRQENFLKEYSKQIDSESIQKTEVEIFRSSYTMTAIKTTAPATIKPKSQLDTFTTCRLGNKIGIFGRTYDFGFFKRELRPILIDTKNYENSESYSYAVNPKISTIDWIGNDMEIVFQRSLFGIRKIKLIDWKK
ncbi:hypothetical protein ACFLSE_10005 [Bacteroidota bacterium]